MNGDGDTGRVEDGSSSEDEYPDIEWADDLEKGDNVDIAANEVNKDRTKTSHQERVDNTDVEPAQTGDNTATRDDHNQFTGHSHETYKTFESDKTLPKSSDAAQSSHSAATTDMDGETNKGTNFYNFPLVGSFRYVTQTSDGGASAHGHSEAKQNNGVQKPSETHGSTSEIRHVGSEADKKDNWITRYCRDPVFRGQVEESIAVQMVVASMVCMLGARVQPWSL